MSTARLLRTLTIGPLPGDIRVPDDDTPKLEEYARSRGLEHVPEGLLPAWTPRLRTSLGLGTHHSTMANPPGSGFFETFKFERQRKRPERRTSDICRGTLPGGATGLIAHHTHLQRWTDAEGHARWHAHPETVVVADLGDAARAVSVVRAARAGEVKALATIDLRRKGSRDPRSTMAPVPVTIEERDGYRWRFQPAEDPATVEAVLAAATPHLAGFGEGDGNDVTVEIEHGILCVVVEGAHDDPERLDALCRLGSAIVAALQASAARYPLLRPDEHVGAPEPTPRRKWIDDGVATVAWPEPPADYPTAVEAYRKVARARGRKVGWSIALLLFLVLAPLLAGGLWLMAEVGVAVGGVVTATVGAWFMFKLVRGTFRAGREISADERDERAYPWALTAFVRGYASTRGLSLEDQDHLRHRFVSPLRGRPTVAMHGLLDTGVPGHLAYWPEPLEDGSSRLWSLAIVAAPAELGPVAEPFVAAKIGDLLVVGREVDAELRGPADFDTVAATAAALTRGAPVAVA